MVEALVNISFQRFLTFCLVVSLPCLVTVTNAHAQSGKEFFPQGFANDPLSNSTGNNGSQKRQEMFPESSSADEMKGPDVAKAPVIDKPGQQILSLGLLLGLVDRNNAIEALDNYSALIAEKRVRPGTVLLLSPTVVTGDEKLDQLVKGLLLQNIPVQFLSSRPPGYEVERSPTWIVRTQQGEVLLEGLNDPRKYINSRGEFMAPQGQQPNPAFPAYIEKKLLSH